MQVCIALQTDNHATTQVSTGGIPFLPPSQQRQSTEGKDGHIKLPTKICNINKLRKNTRTDKKKCFNVLPNVVLADDHAERWSSSQLPAFTEELQITLKHSSNASHCTLTKLNKETKTNGHSNGGDRPQCCHIMHLWPDLQNILQFIIRLSCKIDLRQ